MYCIECGTQIPDTSKFCQHCGTKQTIVAEKSGPDNTFLKKSIPWYLAWVILHLGFLLIWSDGIFTNRYKTDDFWPFVSGPTEGIGEYDIREFLFYTISPLIILVIISLVKNDNPDEEINQKEMETEKDK